MNDNELSHVGVLGMRWGVRNKNKSSSSKKEKDHYFKSTYTYIETKGQFKGQRVHLYGKPSRKELRQMRKSMYKLRNEKVHNIKRKVANPLVVGIVGSVLLTIGSKKLIEYASGNKNYKVNFFNNW